MDRRTVRSFTFKKRNILIRELMNLIEEAKTIQSEIDATFTEAYQALQQANIEVGIHSVQEIAKAIPAEDSVRIKTRSIMGTEIPLVSCEEEKKIPYYGFYPSAHSPALQASGSFSPASGYLLWEMRLYS